MVDPRQAWKVKIVAHIAGSLLAVLHDLCPSVVKPESGLFWSASSEIVFCEGTGSIGSRPIPVAPPIDCNPIELVSGLLGALEG